MGVAVSMPQGSLWEVSMYKLVVRSVLLLFAGLLILPGSPGIRSTQAQGIDDDDRDDGIPFSHNGKVWPSKKAFIDSGARCATPSVDEIKGGHIQDFLEKFKAKGGKSASTQVEAARAAGS